MNFEKEPKASKLEIAIVLVFAVTLAIVLIVG